LQKHTEQHKEELKLDIPFDEGKYRIAAEQTHSAGVSCAMGIYHAPVKPLSTLFVAWFRVQMKIPE
jgi:hypothetical protein